MTTFVWIGVLAVGFVGTYMASQRVVRNAIQVARAVGVPSILVGATLLSIGTDLPEMANSIISSLAGHGDLNVGDSIGSAVTQATLVLGLLILAGGAFRARLEYTGPMILITLSALGLGVLLFQDGVISRLDALILILVWGFATLAMWRRGANHHDPEPGAQDLPMPLGAVARAMAWLAVVGASTALMVAALIQLSAVFGVPEYLISFFVAAIGTSLPELAVDLQAIREGQKDMALGDILGSSFVDATLSVGIGPLIAPTAITAGLAVRGSVGAMIVFGLIAALVLANRRTLDRRVGVSLLVLYLLLYPIMLR